MQALIQSHKKIIIYLYIVFSALFLTKVGFESLENKGIHKESYSGARLK